MREVVATIDFETRSAADLRKVGSWAYACHPTTEVLCLAFRLPTWAPERTALWHPDFPHLDMPSPGTEELLQLFEWIWGNQPVEAHNAWFERGIWANVLVPQGWPAIQPWQWRCSAAKAAAHTLPRKLEEVGAVLRLGQQKDHDGHKLMLKLSKPRKPRKAEKAAWSAGHGTAPHPVLWWESREQFERLFTYCRQDVLAEAAVSETIPDLSPSERELYLMDQDINERGFQLDEEGVACALLLVKQETPKLNAELSRLTGGAVAKATQRAKLKTWFAGKGLTLADTTKDTIEELLLPSSRRTMPMPLQRALELLQMLGKASTAKYQTMQGWMGEDGRVRGGLLFHGAGTGRWSGSGVQPHNFVRGIVKNMPELWDAIKSTDGPHVQEVVRTLSKGKVKDVLDALSQALRGAIIAPPGRQLYVADYAAIEARVVMWLANEQEALEMFRQGVDIYVDMARSIEPGATRQLGKQAVLGCFAAGTLVLTLRGWVPIETITLDDKVWDGIEWVQQDGLLDQGIQDTTSWLRVHVTPDHKIWTGDSWKTVQYLAQSEHMFLRNKALNTAHLPWLGSSAENAEAFLAWWCAAHVDDRRTLLPKATCDVANPLDVMCAPNSKLLPPESTIGATRTLSPTQFTENDCLTASAPSSPVVRTPKLRNIEITAAGVSMSLPRGYVVTPNVCLLGDELSYSILLRYPDGTTQSWNWTDETTIAGMSQAIYSSYRNARTTTTDGDSGNSKPASESWRQVYDIANAGPRRRFTVLTSQGPLLVSNCGFQMGAPKFQATCDKYGIIISEELAKRTVTAYREKFWRVVEMWAAQEGAAKEATLNGEGAAPVMCGKTQWLVEGDYLYCVLPSGRRLAYPEPRVEMWDTSWGTKKLSLTFTGVSPYTRKWVRRSAYGGLLVENITQAVARDLMADAIRRADESHTYDIVLSVHDELIAEADIGKGSVAEFVQLMSKTPAWADGCPVEAEGWSDVRYRK